MATAVPSGMRSIAAKNITPISPLANPRPKSTGTSWPAHRSQRRPRQSEKDPRHPQ